MNARDPEVSIVMEVVAQRQVAGAGHLLLRHSTCLVEPTLFAVRYGQTGGEATVLTYGPTRRG